MVTGEKIKSRASPGMPTSGAIIFTHKGRVVFQTLKTKRGSGAVTASK